MIDLSRIIGLWRAFTALEVDADNRIIVPFMDFPAGTKRQEIYEWFECRYPDGCMGLDAIVEDK